MMDLVSIKKDLMNAGCEIPKRSKYFELQELYQSIIVEKKLDIVSKDIREVEYPKLPVTSINSSTLDSLHRTTVRHIASIFNASNLSKCDIIALMHLFSVLVTYKQAKLEKISTRFIRLCLK